MPALSVIIPTLNEASELPETLKRARAIPEVKEIIVVDAGSTDDTRAIAREHNCTVIESEPSRGKQLRLGATGIAFNHSAVVFACEGLRGVRAAGIDHDDFPHFRNRPRALDRLRQFTCLVERGDDDRQGHR